MRSADVLRRGAAIVVIALAAAACGDADDGGDAAPTTTAPVEREVPATTSTTTTTTVAADPAIEPDWPVAMQLTAATTGVQGGVAAGECDGDPGDPDAGLEVIFGDVLIDDAFADELGADRVFENFDIRGGLIVEADDVTIRCGRINSDNLYAVQNRSTGVRYEWIDAEQADNGKVILGGNYEIERCNISGGEDGLHVNTGEVTVTECYIHDQNFIGAAHADAIQATSGGTVDRIDVVRSKLINFHQAPNAAFQINVADAWSITESYLWGGAYMILGDPGATGQVTDNYFGWASSQFGAVGGVNADKQGNVWWEWVSPRCEGIYSAVECETPPDHPGNGTPIASIEPPT